MSTPIIAVENLSKRFIISHEGNERYIALRDIMTNKARGFIAKQEQIKKEEFWALKDINFVINQGDRVGIIGRNGAGKSTLLKILSRITEPTEGKIRINGRVASLLEVGTGFHPELSGRENIFLNGAILGMSRAEIRKKFDEIVAFAEVEKFLDTPVKRYSSGMYVRLAFAVAAHLEPEILIVDEVLAVGDSQFQKKCLGKMDQVSKDGGRTVLFVSHNIESITKLCNTGILLNHGNIISKGSINQVAENYQLMNEKFGSSFTQSSGIIRDVNLIYKINSKHLCDLKIEAEILLKENIFQPVFGVLIKDLNDNSLVAINNKHFFKNDFSIKAGTHKIDFEILDLPLTSNTYKVDIFFGTGATDIEVVVDKIYFALQNSHQSEMPPIDLKLNKIYVKEINFEIKKAT